MDKWSIGKTSKTTHLTPREVILQKHRQFYLLKVENPPRLCHIRDGKPYTPAFFSAIVGDGDEERLFKYLAPSIEKELLTDELSIIIRQFSTGVVLVSD